MGLIPPTSRLVYSLSATWKATTTCTITLLRSLGDPGYVSSFLLVAPTHHALPCYFVLFPNSGAFDAPKSKCPPDRGSSDCVTGSSAPFFSFPPSSISSSPTSFSTSPSSAPGLRAFTKSFAYSPTTAAPITTIDYTHGRFQPPFCQDYSPHPTHTSHPRAIPAPARSDSNASWLGSSTPPLSPDDGSYSSSGSMDSMLFNSTRQTGYSPVGPKTECPAQPKDALDYLMTIFPKDGSEALPYSKSVTISASSEALFEGVVTRMPGKPQTLYVDGKNAALVGLRERYVSTSSVLSCTVGGTE